MILRGGSLRQLARLDCAAQQFEVREDSLGDRNCETCKEGLGLDGAGALLECLAPHTDEGQCCPAVGFRRFLDDLFAATVNYG